MFRYIPLRGNCAATGVVKTRADAFAEDVGTRTAWRIWATGAVLLGIPWTGRQLTFPTNPTVASPIAGR